MNRLNCRGFGNHQLKILDEINLNLLLFHFNLIILALLAISSCVGPNNKAKSNYVYVGKVLEKSSGEPCVNFEVELVGEARNSIFNFEASPPCLGKTFTDKKEALAWLSGFTD